MAASAENELELLERVLLRLAAAETDEQLEKSVAKFLTPTLLKLASPHESVKKKVMAVLTHINKRLKSRPKIQLPVDDLLSQFQDATVSQFVNNFTILYLKMGVPRLDAARQVELCPVVLNCLHGRPSPQQDCLLQLVLPVLGQIKMPDDTAKREKMFEFKENQQGANVFLGFVLDVLLTPYNPQVQQPPPAQQSEAQEQEPPQSDSSAPPPPPPGLSHAAVKRVRGESPLESSKLEQFKLGILKFLGADLFPATDVICHFLVATGDARHSVVDTAEHDLKRISSSTDWENRGVVNTMFAIFQGTAGSTTGKQVPSVPADQVRAPAHVRVKQRMFPFFLRSRRAADQFPACLQVIFESLFGSTSNAKLRVYAAQLVHHMCLCSSDKVMAATGPVLLSGMNKLIAEQTQDVKLRGLAYVALGKLARRLPQLFSKDVALIQRLFQRLAEEDSDTRLAVQEALSMMAPAYRSSDGTIRALVEALILNNVDKESPHTRLVAVQFANIVFPSTHTLSRYVCMLAVADVKDDVREEAKRGLRPPQTKELRTPSPDDDTAPVQLPSFPEMVSLVAQKAQERVRGPYSYVVGTVALPFSPLVFSEVLLYLRHCLEFTSGVSEEDRVKSRTLLPVSGYIEELTSQIADEDLHSSAVGKYMGVIKEALKPVGGAELHAVALYSLLQVVAASPTKLPKLFHDQLHWIKGFLGSSREETREFAGRLLAVVTCTMSAHVFTEVTRDLSSFLTDGSFEMQHGAIAALGFIIARQLHERSLVTNDSDQMEVEDLEDESRDRDVRQTGLSPIVQNMVELIDDRNTLISCAACNAVGEIGRGGALPLPDGHAVTQQDADSAQNQRKDLTKLIVVEKLIDRLLNAKENKVQERAAHALGFLMVGEHNFAHREKLVNGLCEASSIRQIELQFNVGEALSCVGAGKLSEVARDPWTLQQPDRPGPRSEGGMEALIRLIVTKYADSDRSHVRQASCVWLLSIVKHSGRHPAVQSNLKEIQVAFMNLLAETNELTQEVASKGLGLVYEHGGLENKDELVAILVDTLMTGRRRPRPFTGDSRVFEEGEIGKSPEGGGLSTYKELCSIASDLNQPDLIYKFMHLANHNALWNSRKGAAFGFSSIAAHSREQLEPYLPKIVPKLFRYQYDPNVKIQQAMSSIWAALVSESKKTIDKYMKEILADLIENLNSNLWRVRQSSCLALSDLLSGRSAEDIVDALPRLWELCFRVLDDFKESARQAADNACRTLSKVTIRVCDVNQGKQGEAAMAQVLPVLLHTGLLSGVAEVRSISLSTILKISKNAGALLKPHIPVLVAALLESLSGLEDQAMNYVSLRLHSHDEAQEKLDSVRIAASKMSPMMETVNMCVQYVDAAVLSELIPRVTELLRNGIGLGTKVGCSGFVVSLCMQCQQELAPYAGKLLSALLSGLGDRNSSVRKSYASAIGHVVKVAKDSSVEKLIARLRGWYFEKKDEGVRLACGLTLQYVTRYSPDVLKRHTAAALPVAYFAMHEETKKSGSSNQSPWEEIWLDNTPGTEAGLRLYVGEITEISCTALTSQSWGTKAQAARTVSSLAEKLGANLPEPHLSTLLNALIGGLAGRTWTGKESLLEALSRVCVKCRRAIQSRSSVAEPSIGKALDAVFKECRKENPTYKTAALTCYGEIVMEYSIDRFREISDLLFPLIDPPDEDANEEEHSEEESDAQKIRKDQGLLLCAFECLGRAWPPDAVETQDEFGARFCQLLAKELKSSTWKVQVGVLAAAKLFVERLDWKSTVGRSPMLEGYLDELVTPVCACLEVKKYAAVRAGALEVLESLHLSLIAAENVALLADHHKEYILDSLKFVYNDKEPTIRDKAATLKKSFHGELADIRGN